MDVESAEASDLAVFRLLFWEEIFGVGAVKGARRPL
jgi:hypothetical protein